MAKWWAEDLSAVKQAHSETPICQSVLPTAVVTVPAYVPRVVEDMIKAGLKPYASTKGSVQQRLVKLQVGGSLLQAADPSDPSQQHMPCIRGARGHWPTLLWLPA